MALTTDLPNFKRSEFKNPHLIAPDAAEFLQAVRTRYGHPIRVTSDARTATENVAAAAPSPGTSRAAPSTCGGPPTTRWRSIS